MYVRLARDGKLAPDQLTAEPRSAGLFIDDGTGFVSGATPTNEVVDATPVTAWTSWSAIPWPSRSPARSAPSPSRSSSSP